MPSKILTTLIILVTLVLILVFSFSWISFQVGPVDIMKYLGAQVGSNIGVSVSVSENPFNTLAQQLERKEIELQEKEKTLEQKEAQLQNKDFSQQGKIILSIIAGLIIVLFILILLNFYFDYKRRKYKSRADVL